MRFSSVLVSLFLLAVPAIAADLKIKVVDPQSAAVFGAQVELLTEKGQNALQVEKTSAEGLAVFRNPPDGALRARILAPGFGVQTIDLGTSREMTVQLHLAPGAETVVVTATSNPVEGEAFTISKI